MTTFAEQMIHLRDLAAGLAPQFGLHTLRSLILRKRYVPDYASVPFEEILLINPTPVIDQVSPKTLKAYGGSSISVQIGDFYVKGISRRYTYEELVNVGVEYIIDGVLSPNSQSVIGGIPCDFVDMTLSKSLTWDMIIRRKADHREA